jgi:hypothetical protein
VHPSTVSIQIGNADVNACRQVLTAGMRPHVGIASIIPFIPRIPPEVSGQGGISA